MYEFLIFMMAEAIEEHCNGCAESNDFDVIACDLPTCPLYSFRMGLPLVPHRDDEGICLVTPKKKMKK